MKKQQLYSALYSTSLTFNQSQRPSDDAIEAYVEILSSFTVEQVVNALKQIILKGSPFYPSCGEIAIQITGKPATIDQDAQADAMAGEIVKAIKQFGSYQSVAAKESLGVVAWRAVEYLGGWQSLCCSDISDLGMLRAQAKRATKSSLLITQTPALLENL